MKEPVVHFALIAFVMLGVHSIYQSFSKPEIVLTEAQVEQMKVAAEKETLETGNQIETAQLVRTYIEDQILLEEALRRDLTESSQVKEILVELIRNELKPVLREPSDEELIELRQTAPEEYRFPPRLSFEHVSYRKDSIAMPDNLLAQLNSGKKAAGLGDPIRLANPLPLTYKPQLDRLLGEAVSDALFELELGQWQGPYVSDRGTHFVRIIEKIGPMDMPFEQVRRTLQSNWESAQQQAAVDAAIHELAKPYLIEVPAPYVDVVP